MWNASFHKQTLLKTNRIDHETGLYSAAGRLCMGASLTDKKHNFTVRQLP